MHVITNCPRCGKDFMYHRNDVYLFRPNMPPSTGALGLNDKDLKKHDTYIVICQDCHEKECEDSKCGEQKFCEHVEEWDEKGIPWGTSNLVELAKKYGTEIPTLENGELKWKDKLIPNQKL